MVIAISESSICSNYTVLNGRNWHWGLFSGLLLTLHGGANDDTIIVGRVDLFTNKPYHTISPAEVQWFYIIYVARLLLLLIIIIYTYILSSSSLLWRQAKENSREWERQSFDIMTREYVHTYSYYIYVRERRRFARTIAILATLYTWENWSQTSSRRDRVVLILLEDVSKTHTNINFEEVIFLRLDIICFCF